MSAQLLEHVVGVCARVAPTEADHLHIVLDERPRDFARDHVSALDGVNHEDAVADAGSSVVSRKAPESPQRRSSRAVLPAPVVEGADVGADQVVGVHPVPFLDRRCRHTDRHAGTDHGRTDLDRFGRDLVPQFDVFTDQDELGVTRDLRAGSQVPGSDIDVVAVGEPQQPRDARDFTPEPDAGPMSTIAFTNSCSSPTRLGRSTTTLSSVGRWLIHGTGSNVPLLTRSSTVAQSVLSAFREARTSSSRR